MKNLRRQVKCKFMTDLLHNIIMLCILLRFLSKEQLERSDYSWDNYDLFLREKI